MKVINIIKIGFGIFFVVILLIAIIYSLNKSNVENVRNDFSKESEPIKSEYKSEYKSNRTLIDDVIRPPIIDTLMLEENSIAQPAREFEDTII